jgi:hypothetical protein
MTQSITRNEIIQGLTKEHLVRDALPYASDEAKVVREEQPVAQPGSASVSGSEGRRFEPCLADHAHFSAQLPRYLYETGGYRVTVEAFDEYGCPKTCREDIDGFLIHDRQVGFSEDRHIAHCRDRDNAERIVAALNAVEKVKGFIDRQIESGK